MNGLVCLQMQLLTISVHQTHKIPLKVYYNHCSNLFLAGNNYTDVKWNYNTQKNDVEFNLSTVCAF